MSANRKSTKASTKNVTITRPAMGMVTKEFVGRIKNFENLTTWEDVLARGRMNAVRQATRKS